MSVTMAWVLAAIPFSVSRLLFRMLGFVFWFFETSFLHIALALLELYRAGWPQTEVYLRGLKECST